MGFTLHSSFDLSLFCTFGIGGAASWAAEVRSADDLDAALNWAQSKGLPHLFLGEASNILFPNRGFDGIVLLNKIGGIEQLPDPGPPCPKPGILVRAGSGVNLMDLIRWCNRRGLSGLEKMYGIPGSLGGAVVGNAGAYGQEISSCLESVEVRTETGLRILDRNILDFRYRHSALKDHPGWFLISCILRLRQTGEDLQPASDRILELRETKYPPGLKCPGSFFKNVEAQTLGETVLQNIPSDFITHGKIPAGRLLQEVGACGARSGQAMVAAYHGNLFINLGGASNEDVLRLASHYAGLVFEKYAVRLEPEVLIVPDPAGGIAEFPALSRTRPQG